VTAAWRVRGTYLEACNCDAICPCRRVGGVAVGRSTYGECVGALSWRVDDGDVAGVDLAGLGAVLACRFDDDEEGSPWSYVLYVDDRGDDDQRRALEDVFTGRLGGTALEHFPWAWKPSHLVAVRPAAISIDHTPGRGWFRAGDHVSVRVEHPYEEDDRVSCVIPGHEREGREVVASELRVADEEPLRFTFEGRCGYEATFEYGGVA
jgi:hypothetical protein